MSSNPSFAQGPPLSFLCPRQSMLLHQMIYYRSMAMSIHPLLGPFSVNMLVELPGIFFLGVFYSHSHLNTGWLTHVCILQKCRALFWFELGPGGTHIVQSCSLHGLNCLLGMRALCFSFCSLGTSESEQKVRG